MSATRSRTRSRSKAPTLPCEDRSRNKSKPLSRSKSKSGVPAKAPLKSKQKEDLYQFPTLFRKALALLLLALLTLDMCRLGLTSRTSTPLINWWDMIGTISYLKSRGSKSAYSLRASLFLSPVPIWAGWLSVNTFMYYIIAGKTCRTIMRGVLQTSDFWPEFMITAYLPLHLFPRDALFNMLQYDDKHAFLVAAFWSLTKVRSLNNIVREGIDEWGYGMLGSLGIAMVSWEISSVVSRHDVGLTEGGASLADWWMGFLRWATGRSVKVSAAVAVLLWVRWGSGLKTEWEGVVNVALYLLCLFRYGGDVGARLLRLLFGAPKGKKKKEKTA